MHIWTSEWLKHAIAGPFLEVEIWKRRRHRSAKYFSESKVLSLEVEMLKERAALPPEAHVQVKMLEAPHARSTFET